MRKIILASSSSQRKSLLKALDVKFQSIHPKIKEEEFSKARSTQSPK